MADKCAAEVAFIYVRMQIRRALLFGRLPIEVFVFVRFNADDKSIATLA